MAAPTLIAKALLMSDQGKFLVLRRSLHDEDSPGRVDLPGGGIEVGESYAAAVVREIEEETGLHIAQQDLRLVYAFTRHRQQKPSVCIRLLYVAQVPETAVHLSHEHEMYWWYTLGELNQYFADISWGEGIRFAYDHGLLAI